MEQRKNYTVTDTDGTKREATDKEQIVIRLAKYFYEEWSVSSKELAKIGADRCSSCFDSVDIQLAELFILKRILFLNEMEKLKRIISFEIKAIAECDSTFDAKKFERLIGDLHEVIDESEIL